MMKLQTITYRPSITGKQLVMFCLRQIICSHFNRNVEVFTNPDDPYALDFYSEDKDFEEILQKSSIMDVIYEELGEALQTSFFKRGMFVGNSYEPVHPAKHLRPPKFEISKMKAS